MDFAAKMKEPGRWDVFSGEIICFTSGYAAPEVAARAIMYSLFGHRAVFGAWGFDV